jgi:SAM-dependent methyltransferase
MHQSSHVAHNRSFWDADADDYQAAHGADLKARALAWGAFRIPESELGVLGNVAGLDVLELGCGGAQWSAALDARGARCTGLDVSGAQLAHARAHAPILPLVQASGEILPFCADAFDVVFCDHGATSFCDPADILPEVARVLRPGGLFAFCATDPLVYLTWDNDKEKQTRRLNRGVDDLGRVDFSDDGTIDWVSTPGQWIANFRAHGFTIEALYELRPPEDATTTYADFVPYKWARRWPAEQIWRVRRAER